ncbi:LysR family transcriptional regulator [Burkholderia sp. Ac-20353]|uniref:LysR family transcriptional regulator n=1 Tax=Burkholderia sp. Ac-20353 TaxID=2703894 RepID=UPI00197C6A09|nr:LysR family transcriptional regulator [Burkholderia sp. Ac-20353]MBN3791055.1 LysR family transcriptional regulator [Burkholderia sp. Ac-20353]
MEQPIDLNLLIALDALLTEGSVTAAAERMNMSVPTMSRTLMRIRKMIGDPILVRAGRGLAPTPRAVALRKGTSDIVQQARALLRQDEAFDLRTHERTFTIRADDGFVSSFGPLLLRRMMEAAPLVNLRFSAQGEQDVEALREGQIDLDVGVIADIGPEIVRQTLFRDRFVAAFRVGHPLEVAETITPELFCQYQHVTFSRRGRTSGPVDDMLLAQGLGRRVTVVAPTFAAALSIARETDLVATVAERLTQTARFGMRTRELPVATPPLVISQAWHPRVGADPAHRAIRTLVKAVCETSI